MRQTLLHSPTLPCLIAAALCLTVLALTLIFLLHVLASLKLTRQRLIHSEKMSSIVKMVAGVTHDINSSVGVALSAITFLQDSILAIQQAYSNDTLRRSDLEKYFANEKEALGITEMNLQKVSNLVQSFKRISVDQSSELVQTINVKEYIGQILLSLNPKLRKTDHNVELTCDASIQITTYPGALSQILTNLIDNALIHAFEGIKAGTITISVTKREDSLELRFADNGRGMIEDTRSRIFDPFFTTIPDKEGTGLGLFIVQSLVRDTLKGHIHCESEIGKWTVFSISIPLDTANRSTNT